MVISQLSNIKTIPLKLFLRCSWNYAKIPVFEFLIFPPFSSSSTSLVSFVCALSCILRALPQGGKLDVQSSLGRRAALIGVDRDTWGKDATNWKGEDVLGEGVRVKAMTELLALCHWFLCINKRLPLKWLFGTNYVIEKK